MSRPKWMIFGALTLFSALLYGCGEDPPPPQPEPITGPVLPLQEPFHTAPELDDSPGHWSLDQRGVAIDEEDQLVIGQLLDQVNSSFGVLVLNRPLLNAVSAAVCIEERDAEMIQPLSQIEGLIAQVETFGVDLPTLAVNIDLMYPNRKRFYRLCLESGDLAEPTFALTDHRRHTIEAFRDLARLTQIEYITVGLEMNSYYHLTDMRGVERRWDYANFVTLYYEIYDAIKEVNPDVKVGPGVSWSALSSTSTAQVAAEFDLNLDEPDEAMLAFEIAADRTVWSLLVDPMGVQKADYVGVSLTPQVPEAPFSGVPEPDDMDSVYAFYRNLPLVGAPPALSSGALPIAFTQIDWPSPNNFTTGNKEPFLKTLKASVSHVTPLWVAWRRFSDLPKDPPESSKCGAYTGELRGYGEDYCFSGLVDFLGKVRSVWDEMIQDP